MPPPVSDPGPFLSFLDWANGVGEIPLNLFRGRPGAAGRKLIDTVSSIPDAALPGNWIPELSEEEDSVTASDVLGIDPMQNPAGAKIANLVGGTLTNPLTYFGVRGGQLRAGAPFNANAVVPGVSEAVTGAKRLTGQAWNKVPESIRTPLEDSARVTGDGARRTLNYLDVPAEGDELLARSASAGSIAQRAGQAEVERLYKPLTELERGIVGDFSHGIARNGVTDRTKWQALEDVGDLDAYIANNGGRVDVVKQAIADRRSLMGTYLDEGIEAGAYKQGAKADDDYIKRQMSGSYFNDVDIVDRPLAARDKTLKTNRDLLRFMQEEKGANLEFDALKADAARTSNQGRLVQKAQLARKLTKNDTLNLSDEGANAAVDKAIAGMASSPERGMRDYAYKLQQAWKGTPPRGKDWFSQGLLLANKTFKSAATFGVVLPRVGFNFGNRLSGTLGQIVANPDARRTILESTKRFPGDLAGAYKDGLIALRESLEAFDSDLMKTMGSALPKGGERRTQLSRSMEAIENAFKASGGSSKKARELLAQAENGPALTAALDHGVLDNFVSSENLLSRMAGNTSWTKTKDLMMWPAHIAQGVEQRMRLGTFMDMYGKVPDAQAGRAIKDTFLDYSVPGQANRTFRDIIPFGAFISQNIKQQAKFIAEKPGVAAAAGQLFGDDGDMPKYPWLDQQLAIPTGLDEQGNPQYISSLRLPIEGLTAVPGFAGDDLWRDLVGNSQPMLKTAISYAADKDPFTGRDFGGYDKIMGESAGPLGRAYNVVMGTGLTQAVGTPLKQIENLIDDRKSPLERAGQFLTGIRNTSVDPDSAKKQRIEQYLEANPDVRQYQGYYQTGEDEGLDNLLKDLRSAKDRLAEKRKQAAAVL